jgi:hypothetical protein
MMLLGFLGLGVISVIRNAGFQSFNLGGVHNMANPYWLSPVAKDFINDSIYWRNRADARPRKRVSDDAARKRLSALVTEFVRID